MYKSPSCREIVIEAQTIIAGSDDASRMQMDRSTSADPNAEIMSKETNSNSLWDEIW